MVIALTVVFADEHADVVAPLWCSPSTSSSSSQSVSDVNRARYTGLMAIGFCCGLPTLR